MKLSVLLLGLLFILPSAWGQDRPISVEAQVEAEQIHFGEGVLYQVTVHNVPQSPAPDLSALEKDFTVEHAGDQSLNSQQIININGQITQRVTYGHAFQYRLTPKRSGRLAIAAPVVTVDGQKYQGNIVALHVIAPESQDLAIVELVADAPRAFPFMTFTLTIRVLLKPLTEGTNNEPLLVMRPPLLKIPWLVKPPDGFRFKEEPKQFLGVLRAQDRRGFAVDGFVSMVDSTFSFFEERKAVVLNLPKRREKRAGLDGQELNYFVYELKVPFVPEKPGSVEFKAATLRGQFVTGFQGRRPVGRELLVLSPALKVDVTDMLADPGRPADFTGAYGEVELQASAQPVALRVRDPLTLQLDIVPQSTSVGLELIGPPNIAAQEELARDFEIIDERPVGEMVNGVKRFKYGLRPKKPGANIPPLGLSYFDTQAQKFQRVHSQPVELSISEASGISGADVVAGARTKAEPGNLKRTEGGIYQNLTGSAMLDNQRADTRFYAALPVLLLCLYVLGSLLIARRQRLAGDRALQRRQRALKEARRKLESARAGADSGASSGQIRAALLGLVADLRNLPEAGLTPRDADAALQACGLAAEARQELTSILEALESMAYGAFRAADLDPLRERAGALAARLDREIKA